MAVRTLSLGNRVAHVVRELGPREAASRALARIDRTLRTYVGLPQPDPIAALGRPRNPVFIHQIGKVGSTAIWRAIRDAGHDDHVFQTHVLRDFDRVALSHARTHAHPDETLAQLNHARLARGYLDRADSSTVINVITAVRDPIARDVSAFFQTAIERDSEFEDKAAAGLVSVKAMRDEFFDRSHHATLSEWFEDQFRPVFHFDVADLGFDPLQGSRVFRKDNLRILALKYENYRTELQPVLRSFLSNRRIVVERHNESGSKPYGDLLRRFLSVPFPRGYVDTMLGGRVVQAFYSPVELHLMRVRYTSSA